jgi:hypothetical protein
MRVPEEPVRIRFFRENPVFTSLHLKSPVHVVPPRSKRRLISYYRAKKLVFVKRDMSQTNEQQRRCNEWPISELLGEVDSIQTSLKLLFTLQQQ